MCKAQGTRPGARRGDGPAGERNLRGGNRQVNYYNEFNPEIAAQIQGLMDVKLIPDGHIDTRSITDVRATDLAGFTQCHFFAGIGGWCDALALRRAIRPRLPRHRKQPMTDMSTEPKSKPCADCENRVTAWLTEHMEEWNGPKRGWTKKQKDRWCEYLGLLTLFVQNFHFPTPSNDPAQSHQEA